MDEPTILIGDPLVCSAGGIPYNKAHLDARDAVIRDIRNALAFVKDGKR